MKINISELSGSALDWAVATALGLDPIIRPYNSKPGAALYAHGGATIPLEYSTNWLQGGVFLDTDIQVLEREHAECYYAASETHGEKGPTALIAISRAVVGTKFGEEIEIPNELLELA